MAEKLMRIAASTYLNSAPLVHSFTAGMQRNRVIFIGDTAPSRCAQMLASGQCEIALIPVIEYLRIPNLRIVPNVAVASKHRVGSVILAARCPLESVTKVALDCSSRTSQSLVKILLAHRYHSKPVYGERTPDVARGCANMLEGTDAALLIGDPTFDLKANAAAMGLHIHDLAEEWRAMTGLPFVFAVWAVREDALEDFRRVRLDFEMAKREGIDRIPEIAAQYAATLQRPLPELLDYLRANVNFDLDEENVAGLREYFRLAHEYGLVERNRALQFVDE
ncbi:MAG TPA: menaquinone biosynthesis protein [Blastocatellia bacterium]|nr:menaquinone biosynthesis protein [Blastocatellia bacterium]